MEPAAVQEHRAERGDPDRSVSQDAAGERAQSDFGACREAMEQLARDEPQLADRACESRVRPHALHQHPDRDIDRDESYGDHRGAESRVIVAVGKHAPIISGGVARNVSAVCGLWTCHFAVKTAGFPGTPLALCPGVSPPGASKPARRSSTSLRKRSSKSWRRRSSVSTWAPPTRWSR